MNPKISVIVPVYGVERYLDRCVSSIVNQTYKNLEIILVDDGSPDNCPKMCDEWALKDKRIKTVHRQNGGQSCARNTGLSIATGDYITFIDSDDWIGLDTYQYCISLIESQVNVDCVQFDILQSSVENPLIVHPKETIAVYQGKQILQYYMDSSTRKSGGYSVCRCLFKASIAKRYYFREGKINEDLDYKFKVLRDCERMLVSNSIKYFYWQAGESTSSGSVKAKDFQLYEAADELYRLCQLEDYGNIAYLGLVKKSRTAFSLLCRIALWGISDPELDEKIIIPKLLSEHRKALSVLLKAPIPLSRKLLSVMFAINFKFTKRLISLVH